MNDKLYLDIGSNHSGSHKRAIDLIREVCALKRSLAQKGKDIIAGVKFQVFDADRMYSKEFADVSKSLKGLEIPVKMLPGLLNETKGENIEFGISVFDSKTLFEISDLDGFLDNEMVYLKIASSNLLLIDFIKYVAMVNAKRKVKKPLHISTGNSSLTEISNAIKAVVGVGSDLLVYHCTMEYPCDVKHANISKLYSIASCLSDAGIQDPFNHLAYSDHTGNLMTVLSAFSIVDAVEIHFDRECCDGYESMNTSRCNDGKTHIWPPSRIALLSECLMDIDSSLYGCDYLGGKIDHRADPSDGLRPMKEWRVR